MTISGLQKILKDRADSMVDRNDSDDNDLMDGEQIYDEGFKSGKYSAYREILEIIKGTEQ